MTVPPPDDAVTVDAVAVEHEAHAGDPPSTVYWPALTRSEAEQEWPALRAWAELLRQRFPNALRLPECWWRHNDLVELLAALRDGERAAFHQSASAAAPLEWHRALREAEARIEGWVKRYPCGVRGHDAEPADWDAWVQADLGHRVERHPA